MTQEKLGNLTVLNSHKERTAKFAHHSPHFKIGGHRRGPRKLKTALRALGYQSYP